MGTTFSSVLVVDKPRGPTSHDVVAKLRRALRTKHVGHCGTLDPMATGVLVVAVDDGTKLVPWLTADDKAYEATVCLGVATDSLDADGVRTAELPLAEELRGELATLATHATHGQVSPAPELPPVGPLVARALATERARTLQLPPAISAIRIGGERAHEIARRGEAPELALRECAVRRLEILGGGLEPAPHLRVMVEVTKGYFVRSLARDLAESLGTVGHLTALRRTRSGAFTVADAVSLDRSPEELRAALMPIERAAARALPVSVLTEEGVRAAGFGQRLMPGQLRDPHAVPSAWLDEAGALVAVGEVDPDGGGRVLRGFPRQSPPPAPRGE
jgi:tRNA pseudouridine55 synthase